MSERYPAHSATLVGAAAVCGAAGTLDGFVAALRAGSAPATVVAAIALCTGLWAVAGLAGFFLWSAGWRVSRGPGGWTEQLAEWRDAASNRWATSGSDEDRQFIGKQLATATAFGCWLAGSVILTAHLIENRHGAYLIATASVVGSVALAVGALWLRAALARVTTKLPLLSTRRVLVAASVALASGVLLLTVTQSPLLLSLGVPTWLSLALTALAAAAFGPRIARRVPRPAAALVAVVGIATALTLAGATSSAARSAVVTRSTGAGVLLAQLQSLTDFDHDGAAYLPAFEDCGPFDPEIGPLVSEKAVDGIDSNCDGEDAPPQGLALEWPATGAVQLPGDKPDLVLITVDAWRADSTGFTGGTHEATPNLDAFAKQGVVFANAWSQDSGTAPALWSLMAGKTPFQTRLEYSKRFPPPLAADQPTLAEQLTSGGYRTTARLCGEMFGKKHWGIDRGFADFREVCGKRQGPLAASTVVEAQRALRALRAQKQPFFLWVHVFDPHRPYVDHADLNRPNSPWGRYLEEVEYVDRSLVPLLEELRNGPRRTVVAITADHGENFGQHGNDAHARTLYREVTHVPLVMWGTGISPERHESPVAVSDVNPTFLALAHLPTGESTMTSQATVLYGAKPAADRLVFQENSYSRPRRHVKGLVGRGHHLIYDMTNSTWELYDLVADHEEKHDLVGTGLPIENELRATMRRFVQTTRLPAQLIE